MGFLDKLREPKREEKRAAQPADAEARAQAAGDELMTWLASVMQRLQPDQIRFQPGETLGDVVTRILDEEERAVRAGGDPILQAMKLESIQQLRRKFPTDSPTSKSDPRPSGERAMSEATTERPAEATYEVTLGGREELKDVPMATLLELISGWNAVVGVVMAERRLPPSLADEYRGAVVTVTGEEDKEELLLVFHAAKEMIQIYRDKLRELGLDQG